MSTEADDTELAGNGVPELTALGKRIELLRMERRISKRILAQLAGTSRQQLWRVMTGKSELTSSLCARLAEVLEIDSRLLRDALPPNARSDRSSLDTGSSAGEALRPAPRLCETLEDYVSSPDGLERTFETLPVSEDGRRLRRALLNAVEDVADARALKLPQAFFDLRRRVVNDER
jgi:transcriptional regulator with XRE-family HTH domain